jgi:hypothetical protein
VVSLFPVKWILEASIPLLILIAVFLLCYLRARDDSYKVRLNVLAFAGALLAFGSFTTGWSVVESGGDWSISGEYALFLLFTYPFAIVTPLAGIGQAGVLLWVLGYAREHNASITPFYGYLLAWISVILMVASIAWPVGLPRGYTRSDIYDRLLTLTFRQSSRSWMSTKHTVAVLYVLASAGVGALCIGLNAPDAALEILLVGFIFVWLFLGRGSLSTKEHVGNPVPETGMAVAANSAWVLFMALLYIASIVAIETYSGAFGLGPSGWERTRTLVRGLAALAVVVPLALFISQRAVAPRLPRDLTLASVAIFALFILMAALALSPTVRSGISYNQCLVLAGIGLFGPAFFHIQALSGSGRHAGSI